MLVSQDQLCEEESLEIEKLEKLIDDSLVEIQCLQEELKDLEKDLSYFLDSYYGSGAVFFKHEDSDTLADNDNSNAQMADLQQAKKSIYDKIAKVCSHDLFNFSDNHTHYAHAGHDGLLKIEGYLTDGSDQSKSPEDMLSNLICNYHDLMQQMHKLKTRKKNLLDSPAYELKQEVMWANIKTAETISRIKDNITHQVNRPN